MDIKKSAVPENLQMGNYMNRLAGVADKKPHEVQEKVLDKQAFLRMFMEQLKYQDPLNPVKNEQFAQQVAMLTQVEQGMNMNKNLEELIKAQRDPTHSKLAALQMVGKEIKVNRSVINHDKAMASSFEFQLPKDADETRVEVMNEAGEVVRKIDMGARSEGIINVKWDGLNEDGAQMNTGRYSYKVTAKAQDGTKVDVPLTYEGKVDGVTASATGVFLLVGNQKIALNDVETIRNPDEKPGQMGTANIASGTKRESAPVGQTTAAEKPAAEASGDTAGKPEISLDESALKGLAEPPSLGEPVMDPLMPFRMR